MKRVMKRIGASLLVLVFLATMLPLFPLSVAAAGNLSVMDSNIGLYWTDASSSRGKASWSATGSDVTGTATGYKNVINRTITTQLTITNNYAEERTLNFGYALTGGGSVKSIITGTSGTYSAPLAAGASVTITLTSPNGASTNTLSLTGIQLLGNSNVDATFLAPENGSYTVDGAAVTAETTKSNPANKQYTVSATPASGYVFFGWYSEAEQKYLSYDVTATLQFASDPQLKPVFLSTTTALFGVGAAKYSSLTEAGAAAEAGSIKTVVLLNNGTVSGSHTIPAGVTLLVPFNSANTAYGSNPKCTSDNNKGFLGITDEYVDWVKPTAYRTLTLAADANITVNGNIEVGGEHAAAGGTKAMYGGSPTGPLGFINMLAGSHIDLNSGSTLYCWGYIYGDGTITAKNGSAIYENFQIQDFRGGTITTQMAAGLKVFSNSQYYVQNIEVATTYEYGATEYVHTAIFMSSMAHGATVQFIGPDAMFRPEPGSYVVKDYDPTTDNLYLDSYGNCSLGSLSMTIERIKMDSADYVLPITNNIQIRVKSGTATLLQNVMMLPGSSLTVDQGATLNLAYSDAATNTTVTKGGYILQMFDYENYTYGIDEASVANKTYTVVENRYYNRLDVTYGMRSRPVPFTCTPRKTRTEADLKDAVLDINGTLIANGYLYSTVTYENLAGGDKTIKSGGANIISSQGTGSIQMVNGAGKEEFGCMFDQDCSTDGIYYSIPLASAQLRNGNGSMLDTTGAEAGTMYEYCTTHDCWYTGECGCCAGTHTYDHSCDTGCNVCGATRTITHTYDNACDTTCNVCGATRTISHSPAAAVKENNVAGNCGVAGSYDSVVYCSVCGVEISRTKVTVPATGNHTYDNACDTSCNVCGATRIPADHVYGDGYDTTCNVCGAVRVVEYEIYTFLGNSVTESSDKGYGLAFLFQAEVTGMTADEYEADYSSGKVTPDSTGPYTLVCMGTVVSNNGETPSLDALDKVYNRVIDIPVVYLYKVDTTYAKFAVRITNIPSNHLDATIMVRPYCVYAKDGAEVVVYGDVQKASYNEVYSQ